MCLTATYALLAPLRRYTGHTLAKFVITITTGIATGLLASGLTHCVDFLHDWKRDLVQSTLDDIPSGAGG